MKRKVIVGTYLHNNVIQFFILEVASNKIEQRLPTELLMDYK
jgi:hypothetical protein